MMRGRLARGLAVASAITIMAAACTGGSEDKAGAGGGPVVLTMANRYAFIDWEPGAAYFVKRVGELSAGTLRIDVANQWGGEGLPSPEQRIVQDVRDSKVDMGWVMTGVFDTLGIKSFQALTAPMLIDNYPLEQAVIASDIPGQMLKGLARLGVTGLAVLGGSLRKPIARRGPIVGEGDWRGIVFGIIRSRAEAESIQALGANSTDLVGDPLEQALRDGTVQGRDMGLHIYVANNNEDIPYVTANVNLWPETTVLLANPHVLSTLTDEQRGWLRRAAHEAAGRSTSLVDDDAENVTKACQDGAGMSDASEADLAWMHQSLDPVYEDLDHDPETKGFIEAIERLKSSTPAGSPLDIPVSCIGPVPVGSADDPVTGTWQTDRLTETQIVQAFVAVGGSEKDGHEFFSQLGGGSTDYATITLQFGGGVMKEFESGDGKSSVQGFNTTYEIEDQDTITMGGCQFTYRLNLTGDTLRFYVAKPCPGPDAKFGATLVASFPMTRTG